LENFVILELSCKVVNELDVTNSWMWSSLWDCLH